MPNKIVIYNRKKMQYLKRFGDGYTHDLAEAGIFEDASRLTDVNSNVAINLEEVVFSLQNQVKFFRNQANNKDVLVRLPCNGGYLHMHGNNSTKGDSNGRNENIDTDGSKTLAGSDGMVAGEAGAGA